MVVQRQRGRLYAISTVENQLDPKTVEGKERSRQAHIKSGEYTHESWLRHNRALLNLAYMEDMMHMLKMTSVDRTRGPKPTGYVRLTSLTDLIKAIEADQKH